MSVLSEAAIMEVAVLGVEDFGEAGGGVLRRRWVVEEMRDSSSSEMSSEEGKDPEFQAKRLSIVVDIEWTIAVGSVGESLNETGTRSWGPSGVVGGRMM